MPRVTLTNIKAHLLAHKELTGEPQYIVAGRMHIHPFTLSQWALGKVTIPLDKREELAVILGVSPDSLLGETAFEVPSDA